MSAGERAAAPRSALAGLRARREAAREVLHLDLRVPRLEPPVWVRFGPVEQEVTEDVVKRYKGYKAKDKATVMNATILAHACQGIFEVDGDDEDAEKVSIDPEDRHGDWPRFDERLGELLGCAEGLSPTSLVRELYLTSGDIIATAGKLADWSGFSLEQIEESDSGN